jgi:hypothetical protein
MDAGEIRCGNMGWMHLAQDTVQWHDFVNKTRDIQFVKKEELFDKLGDYGLLKENQTSWRSCGVRFVMISTHAFTAVLV